MENLDCIMFWWPYLTSSFGFELCLTYKLLFVIFSAALLDISPVFQLFDWYCLQIAMPLLTGLYPKLGLEALHIIYCTIKYKMYSLQDTWCVLALLHIMLGL